MNTATNNETIDFTRIFDTTGNSIPFKNEWRNGTGYLNSLRDEDLQSFVDENLTVETVKTVDNFGRRVLIVVGSRVRFVVRLPCPTRRWSM